jgi:hypothetical protein
MHTAPWIRTAEGPPDQEGDRKSMRMSLKRVIASLGSLAFLLLAAGAEWKF